jgi:hypothetical protein
MTTEAYRRRNFFYWFKTAWIGAYAGLIAGVPLSMLIVLAQILPVIGSYLRIQGPWVSLFIHVSLSAFFGAVFGIFAVRFHLAVKFHFRFRKTLPAGMGYGALLWFINLLILFPLLFPSSTKTVENMLLLQVLFVGHLFFGVITAMLFTIFYWRSPRIWMRPPGAGNWIDSLQGDGEGNKTIGVSPNEKK